MFNNDIQALLQKNVKDLPILLGQQSLRHDIDELVAMALPPCRVAVVDDPHTSDALGNQVFRALKSRFAATHITLDVMPSANEESLAFINRHAHDCDAYIAVGSGTVNDLCKYLSYKEHKPYIVFPTAASVNGYVSANASITFDGHKQSLPTHMPKAVFCDFSVISSAPIRLSKSGLGDALARPTAQADWLLSNLLLGTAYHQLPFDLLTSTEEHVFDHAAGVAANDRETIELLMELLLLSGFGMTIAGGSYPASQGEHMIAHAYGMTSLDYAPLLHGEEIAVTTLTMAAQQQQQLNTLPTLARPLFPAEGLATYFNNHTITSMNTSYAQKCKRISDASLNQETLEQKWDEVIAAIHTISLPPERLQQIAQAANIATNASAIGWDALAYQYISDNARFTRDRFTFLDIASPD